MSTPQPPTRSACDPYVGALAALALGERLAPEEQEQLLAHLALCAACRRRLDSYAAVARLLPLAAPEAAPSPELRGRILAAAAGGSVPVAPAGAPAPRWRRLLRPALALALVALIALGAAQSVRVGQLEAQLAEQQARSAANGRLVIAAFGNDDAVEIALEATAAAPGASGRAFVSPGEPAAAIYARRLPPLPAGQEYQVWVEHAGGVTSAGRITVNDEGRAWRPLRPDVPLGAVVRLFVTTEPAGGSPQPTGAEVLSGAPERP